MTPELVAITLFSLTICGCLSMALAGRGNVFLAACMGVFLGPLGVLVSAIALRDHRT